ncbi:MAG: GNAT family N-acetyltransferase [Candidatus Lokiarchaeota archaeon]|nr:GNAT family N-acetyltransferase [Candidatus Lokiarchaeota archaeon]
MTEENEKKEEEKELEVFPFIRGERIDLVAENTKWIDLFCKWNNDPEVRRYSRNNWPRTIEELKKWLEPPPRGQLREFITFTIYHKIDKRPIGNIGFGHIRWVDRNANIFAMIGEPEYWGKGIAGEASRLVIEYGFSELNLHKIYAGIYTPNERSHRAAEKLGFKKEGVFKEEEYVDGTYHDVHKYALFKRDWMKANEK